MNRKELSQNDSRPPEEQGFITNVDVVNAFNKKLGGWPMIQDALVFLSSKDDLYLNAENTKWSRETFWSEDKFPVNSDLFRSDEFKSTHEGKHVVFSGCSVTYGVGLYTIETWSHKLYEKIKSIETVSGYYNLGKPGTSVMDIVANIFKYIGLYGKPDVIFLDLPDLNRHYTIRNDRRDLLFGGPDEIDQKTFEGFFHGMYRGMPNVRNQETRIYVYQYLMMLEQYCKDMGIELYIFSYVEGTNSFLQRTGLECMKYLNNNKIIEDIYKYAENNKDKIDEYFLTARDDQHHGWGYHDVWANIMFDEYSKGGGRYVR